MLDIFVLFPICSHKVLNLFPISPHFLRIYAWSIVILLEPKYRWPNIGTWMFGANISVLGSLQTCQIF